MQNDVVEVSVRSLVPTNNGVAVFLGDESKCFVIYVDSGVGAAINFVLSNVKRERPLTHDLIANLLAGFEIQLERVVINDVDEGTFFARIILRMENELGTKLLELDARPSDSIALALRTRRPIYVARSVYESVEDMTELLERVLRQQAEDEASGGEKDE
jgi:bifunctional DNase/RNase